MEKIKIVLTRSMLPQDIAYIKAGFDKEIEGCYEIVIPTEFNESGILSEVGDADILLGPYVTASILKASKKLKLIQVPWTGMDTFDFSSVQGCTVPVCNTHSNADSVAELGVTLVLDLIKKVSYHDRKMRAGNWNRDQKPLDLTSRLLLRQKVCVLGCGNIGYRIAKIISAFGAEVTAVDANRHADEVLSSVYSPLRLYEAISEADVVISSLPLTPDTKGIINDEAVGRMKDGVIVVNVSRAAVMDEDAVYNGLLSGKISGFGADVWWNAPKRGDTESYPSTHNKFHELENVVMSPHRAGFIEGSLPHLDGAIENIINLYKGKQLNCIVNIKEQY